MRIVFLGTPSFAVPILNTLAKHHNVVGVVTQPDKPQGRKGMRVSSSVKRQAEVLSIPIFQFDRIKDREAIEQISACKPDILVTAAYGQILSRQNLLIAPLGVINAHASLLPRYRGPAPVNWCLINGEEETGVTIMHTDSGVDTGDIILQQAVRIEKYMNAEELLGILSQIAGPLTLRALNMLENGTAPRISQSDELASRHPMLTKKDGELDFRGNDASIVNRARGVYPWPGATIEYNGIRLKVENVRYAEGKGEPGEILCANEKQGLVVACNDGAVSIGRLQRPGGKMLPVEQFLRGFKLYPNERFLV